MEWYEILIIILAIPIGFYLRDRTYKGFDRPDWLLEDIEKLWRRVTSDKA